MHRFFRAPFWCSLFAAALSASAQPPPPPSQTTVVTLSPEAAPPAPPPVPPPPVISASVPHPPLVVSPEVHLDRTVTFRLQSPSAGPVLLSLEGAPTSIAMMQAEGGVWEVTVGPLDPEYYGYSFLIDGVGFVDPNNPLLKPNLLGVTSMVHVPGPSYLPWETNAVPHGEVHHHFYRSAVVGIDSDYYVYTPPGYNPATIYPVLYLLHGYSDDASAWTAVGRANVILDNLIASHQARPMVVVMPLGYGVPSIVRHGGPAHLEDDPLRRENWERFSRALLMEVMPRVEAEYHVGTDPDHRAIAGLSMGGAEALLVGLNHLDTFGWIGSFSGGGFPRSFPAEFPQLNSAANGQIRLLWIACGTEDNHHLDLSRRFRAWLAQQGVAHVDIETPGLHDWMVWRSNLAAFIPLLFTR